MELTMQFIFGFGLCFSASTRREHSASPYRIWYKNMQYMYIWLKDNVVGCRRVYTYIYNTFRWQTKTCRHIHNVNKQNRDYQYGIYVHCTTYTEHMRKPIQRNFMLRHDLLRLTRIENFNEMPKLKRLFDLRPMRGSKSFDTVNLNGLN